MPEALTGLSFFNPAALWALATLAIPILIHLFNRSRGRLVKIGHIDLIRNARKLKVTEVKLADWLLLLSRLCLFALAALLLAELARPGLSSSKKTTAYISTAWLKNTQAQAVSDMLERYSDSKSSRVILLQDDFPTLDSQLAERIRLDTSALVETRNLWPLLAERLSLEHHQGSVDVYAVDDLEQFGTSRPALPGEVNWHLKHIELSDSAAPVVITAMLAYDQTHGQDAEFLNSALTVLQANRLPGLSWQLVGMDDLSSKQQVDWLIVLSDSANGLSEIINSSAPKVVLTDAFAPINSISTQKLRLPFYPFSEFSISRTGTATNKPTSLISLANKQPVLQQSWQGASRLVHFNSRFNTAWSSIVQQPEFPELLLQLMLSDAQRRRSFAGAGVLSSQLHSATPTDSTSTVLPRRSLQQLLAALMVLIWVTERWLSERKRREQR